MRSASNLWERTAATVWLVAYFISMTWATEGTFFVGIVTVGFLMASALLGVAFKLVVQLTRLETKIDANTMEHQEVLKRIERLEAAVFPTIARMAEGLSHIYFGSRHDKGE